ncbi:ricin-type beta-trefoil lectin domain protein [Paraferrimonas sedimenticola]|uniref:Ricin B lectin domain-containing protein n=1 Tax=Paraferrimonas sedimenticola TaxID=375674 RepID=A0AA37RRI0_9GAMM|nr:ricin-type beta-trefoil lectin domain protein [Paraferrimonas sedimenticola]GLP95011.1 hypothetical protein GCM10007895_03170 [Paraferrimonas sedimenticola]
MCIRKALFITGLVTLTTSVAQAHPAENLAKTDRIAKLDILEQTLPQAFTILRESASMCLAPVSNNIRAGSKVVFTRCNQQLPQVWSLTREGKIRHQVSGHCLVNVENTNDLAIWPCHTSLGGSAGLSAAVQYVTFPDPHPLPALREGQCSQFSSHGRELRLQDYHCKPEQLQPIWMIRASLMSSGIGQ